MSSAVGSGALGTRSPHPGPFPPCGRSLPRPIPKKWHLSAGAPAAEREGPQQLVACRSTSTQHGQAPAHPTPLGQVGEK